jgi:hypothetical protein
MESLMDVTNLVVREIMVLQDKLSWNPDNSKICHFLENSCSSQAASEISKRPKRSAYIQK